MPRNVGIAGVGYCVPERVVTNKELEKEMNVSDQWIQEKIGIKERRIAAENEALSDLGYRAAVQAMKMANVAPEELDLIIVCAINHDKRAPSTACILQKMLKASKAAAFDINVGGCPGTGYALIVGQQFVGNGMYDRVLVVSGEIYSKLLDWSDRNTAVFFGDGVGAAVLKPSKASTGFISSVLGADGKGGDDAICLEGGSRIPYSREMIENRQHRPSMDNKKVWSFAVKMVPELIREVTGRASVQPRDLDWVILHQANINLIKRGLDALAIPMSKTFTNIHKFGNTGAGSAMIALAEAVQDGLIRPGHLVAIASFGAGFSWGAVVTRWCGQEDFLS